MGTRFDTCAMPGFTIEITQPQLQERTENKPRCLSVPRSGAKKTESLSFHVASKTPGNWFSYVFFVLQLRFACWVVGTDNKHILPNGGETW